MIISPAQDLPLPDDVQKALKNARNAVTFSEAEHRRLVEMRIAEETTIVELSKRKAYEESLLEDISLELSKTKETLTKLKHEEGVIKADIKARQDQIKKDEESIQSRKQELEKAELDLEARSKNLVEKETDYSIKHTELYKEIEAHNNRVSILDKALAQL